jgi:hypothetical protein
MFYYVCFEQVSGTLYCFSSNNAIIAPEGYTIEEREGQYPQSLDWWSPTDRKFIAPEVRIITKLEFLSRFSITERVAIRETAKTDPVLNDVMTMLDLAEEINLDDPRTQQSLGYMVSITLLTVERMSQILG